MAAMNLKDYERLDQLSDDWETVFDETMPWGFGIGEDQLDLLQECITQQSKEPLEIYVRSLPPDNRY